MRKQEEMRVNQRKMGVIFANARKMSKYAEKSTLKVNFEYAILKIDMSIYLVITY